MNVEPGQPSLYVFSWLVTTPDPAVTTVVFGVSYISTRSLWFITSAGYTMLIEVRTSMKYQVVFDASQQGYNWMVPSIGLLVVLGGVIIWVNRRYIPVPWKEIGSGMALVCIVFASCLTAFGFLATFQAYESSQEIIRG